MKLLKLDLGCGSNAKNGYIGIDIFFKATNIIKSDALKYLKKLPNNSVSDIWTSHFLEHVSSDYLNLLFKEIDRVLIKNGELVIIVPHFSNPYFFSDPTHKIFWGVHSLSYVCEKTSLTRKVPSYISIKNWELRSVKIRFISMFKPKLLGVRIPLPSNVLNLVLNSHHYLIELYERYFCYIFSIFEIKFTIKKH